jgi:hypothetical protein
LWYYEDPLEDRGGAPLLGKDGCGFRSEVGELRCRFEAAGEPSEYCDGALQGFNGPLESCDGSADSRESLWRASMRLRSEVLRRQASRGAEDVEIVDYH